ncbi:protein RETICULATA, chloroplastic-like [Actinidia eriantha]|uniref:protein RETICULATA, chloroplastic-like n=1 Tax=Actinidia eriantha TaxID=165200 RepID=UPI00258393A7|nr:protein RETICULATA, chloroplastic-like [Actinidia eriantha]
MACCSSSIRLSLHVSLQDEVVLGTVRSQNGMIPNFRAINWSKKSRHLLCSKRKQRLVVANASNSGSEPQSGVVVTVNTNEGDGGSNGKDFGALEANYKLTDSGSDGVDVFDDGNNGNGKFLGGGGGWGGEGGGEEEQEFGPIMKFEEVMKETKARGASLPMDMLEAAKSVGIRKVLLLRYLDLQGSAWPLGFAMKSCSMLRNRMLADPSFLFKVGTEIVIDSCCATLAEVQKRGKDFWAEFELYLADLLVGVVVNVALVGMLAPYARIGQPSISKGAFGHMQNAYAALPSSVFEAERPGCRFSVKQRIATYFFKGVMYASVGFACGLIGQGIANLIMTAKRTIRKSEEDIPVPPLLKSAALWGVFLAVSSNTRYQIINGLEQLVESSPLAKQVPPVAMAFTVGVRFANNIYGGMQFVDWARWSGVQ